MAAIELRLLGGFTARVDGREVDPQAWRLRKARSLVKLLVLEPGRRLHREQMMELLWPERDAASAQNNLHQALHSARQVVGTDSLTLTDGVLALAPTVWTDIDAFTAAADAARAASDAPALAAALDLYAGELLPEDRYEPWTDARRTALGDLYSALCLDLARLQPPEEALRTLQRCLDADPLHEPAHRALMETYARLGRRQDALAQFHRLRSSLGRALAAEPDAETRDLYRRLLTASGDDAQRAAAGLPVQVTSFVGREQELADIAAQLETARVLTLTGPGGSGKTRLAVAAAERAGAVARDGVVFVELGAIADPELVAEAAATAVGIRVPSRRAAAAAIVDVLRERRLLLVLDTCEHVLPACAALAEALVGGCPRVTVLATSREPLRCGSETVWRVPGLDPSESVALFLSRASAAGASPSSLERSAVEALCERLDGMPLALELAAARAPALAPEQIAARLDRGLDILSSGRRTGPRQQTLRATIAWSHDLLTGEERVLFRRLAAFAGSFSLDAAEEVCTGGALEAEAVLELLMRLVDKSLVVVDDAGRARYRLLDTVRQFAAEQLTEAGEREAVEARLRSWAAGFAAEDHPLDRIEPEHDNLRAALDSALRSDPQGALRLALELTDFWLDRNYFTEGVRRLRAVLDAAPDATELRASAMLAAAALELRCGELDAFVARAREAEAVARPMRPAFAADVVHRAGLLYTAGLGFDDCRRACDEALALAAPDDTRLRASILSVASLPAFSIGDFAGARERLEAALALLARAGDRGPPFFEGVTFGFVNLPEGRDGRPRLIFEETIMHFHRFASGPAQGYCRCNLAAIARSEGRADETRAQLDEALELFRRHRDGRGEAQALCALGNAARTFGEPDRALAWLEQALELRRRRGDRRAVGMTENDIALSLAYGGDLEGARSLFAAVRDRFRAADDAPGHGGALASWAIAEERSGNLDRAAELAVAAADVWERHLRGLLPGWGRLAQADALLAVGDVEGARAALTRAERLFERVGDPRGHALCLAHPAAKAVLSGRKPPSS